jgi:hypothetical protein
MRKETMAKTKETTVTSGTIAGFDPEGKVLVRMAEAEKPLACFYVRSTEGPRPHLGIGDTALVMVDGKDKQGYILGLVEPYFPHLEHMVEEEAPDGPHASRIELQIPGKYEKVYVNGKTVAIEAEDEIQLKCGKGTICINKHGKIVVRGTNVLSRSSGTNRIKGASVSIN